MSLEKLSDWPSTKALKNFLIICIIILLIIYPIMTYLFTISYPVSFIESQLSFSGQLIKQFNTSANIELYRIANILDYFFMLSYGGIFFCIGLIIARKFNHRTIWRRISFILIPLTIIAPLCDAIENIFILLMLTDPLGFPDIWAITHSCFALIKYIVMFIGFGWLGIALIKLWIIRKPKKSL
ncbi:MAG: hypothetical protein ACFE9S_17230 [Candidatus Hermodarchaeota archaeon]